MKILGIDTSGYANAVGVVDDSRVLADFSIDARNDSLEKIVAHIDTALASANLTLEDIEGIGVGVGPGSWTGIRVGVTVGKILAYSAGKSLAGVPTLEVLAYAARNKKSTICAIINAGTKGTIYAAFYRFHNNNISRVGEYYVGDIPGLAELITGPVVLVSKEANYYGELIMQAIGSGNIPVEIMEDSPGGAAVALLAAARLEQGESDDVLSLTPLYLKESTAKAFVSKYRNKTQA